MSEDELREAWTVGRIAASERRRNAGIVWDGRFLNWSCCGRNVTEPHKWKCRTRILLRRMRRFIEDEKA